MFAIIIATALAGTSISSLRLHPPQPCSLKQIQACKNSSDLAGTVEFEQALPRFTRPLPGIRIDGRYGNVWMSAVPRLGSMNGEAPVQRLSGGNLLFRGSLALEDSERGAALISADGRILALGLLVNPEWEHPPRWDLHIFMPRTKDSVRWFRIIRTWSKQEVKESRSLPNWEPHTGSAKRGKTLLHWVTGDQGSR